MWLVTQTKASTNDLDHTSSPRGRLEINCQICIIIRSILGSLQELTSNLHMLTAYDCCINIQNTLIVSLQPRVMETILLLYLFLNKPIHIYIYFSGINKKEIWTKLSLKILHQYTRDFGVSTLCNGYCIKLKTRSLLPPSSKLYCYYTSIYWH